VTGLSVNASPQGLDANRIKPPPDTRNTTMNNENTDPQPQAAADDSAEQDFQRALDRVDDEPEQATFAEGLIPQTQNPVDIAEPEPTTAPESTPETPPQSPQAELHVDTNSQFGVGLEPATENSSGSGTETKRRRGRSRRGRRGASKSGRQSESNDIAVTSTDATSTDGQTSGSGETSGRTVKKEMLINALQPEESRIAITEDGVLEELYVERNSLENCVANIYKARVVNIEPSIQAAFVDFGVGRNGFLHVSDVEYQYYKHLLTEKEQTARNEGKRQGGAGNDRGGRNKPPIQDIFKKGSEVVVQVIKEGIGTKGPTLSTYVSIPGRYLVLMPALGRVGVSRKIEGDDLRRKLRKLMNELEPPPGVGFIVRTAGSDRTKRDLQRDMNYLIRLWKVLVGRISSAPTPAAIYEDSDMVVRTIRDIYNSEIETVWIDDKAAYQRAQEFMKICMPRQTKSVRLYEDSEPIFQKWKIESEIEAIQDRTVVLKGGGSIVIDQTEALVAIDVNSGTFRTKDDAETSAYKLNLKAAAEICRQIRLRDLGGVIVNDFIDMHEEKNRRGVEKALKDAFRRDRARTKLQKISMFGLLEMTRQRIRPSLKRSVYEDCDCCEGTGLVKTAESVAIEVMRLVASNASRENVKTIRLEVHQRVGEYLNNRKRSSLNEIEQEFGATVSIATLKDCSPNHLKATCKDQHSKDVRIS
jgi:ribonuclease E